MLRQQRRAIPSSVMSTSSTSSLVPRYAAHRVRLGDFVACLPLVSWQVEGGFTLRPFVEEGERTIFLSGTLELHHPDFPLCTDAGAIQEVPLETLARMVASAEGWELRYSGQLLLPPP